MARARVTWTCALTTLVVGLAPAAAQGGTLTVSWQPEPEDGDYDLPTAVFRAASGERDRVVMTGTEKRIDIRDVEPLRLVVRERRRYSRLPSCKQVAPEHVRCAARAFGSGRFQLGDRDDRYVDRIGVRLPVHGGKGDDVLRGVILAGGPGRDSLTGGPGDDFLVGGRGKDRLHGRSGSDNLCGDCGRGPARHDLVDGGLGVDEVTFDFARRIQVDLSSPGPDGEVGAGDTLRDTETVRVWSTESGLLVGDDGPNTLIASGPGVDRVDGRGGDDTIIGGPGDHLAGNFGNDEITVQGSSVGSPDIGRAASLYGGDGEDFLTGSPTSDVMDCGADDDATTSQAAQTRTRGVSCEFFANHAQSALWAGVDPRLTSDAIEVRIRWRAPNATRFSASFSGSGAISGVPLASASGVLKPGVQPIRVPFTDLGRTYGGWTSESQYLGVSSAGRPGESFGAWLFVAPPG